MGGDLKRRAVVTTLKGAWAQSKVWLDTSDPNLNYRALTRAVAKGPAQIWCTKRWASEEEASWNPEGQSIIVTLIPLIKIK